MKKAAFLDRDGTVLTLIDGMGYLKDIKRMRLLPGAAKAIAVLNKEGFLVFIVSNQTTVAWGQVTEKQLQHMHKVLDARLRLKGAVVSGIYYCPHHPEAPLKKYRIICNCRKPKIGMLKKVIHTYHVDPKQSFMVGDGSRDILTGEKAGMKTILVKTGNAGKEHGALPVKPDFIEKNLLAAALRIKKAAPKGRPGTARIR